jgi:hypothetical protein
MFSDSETVKSGNNPKYQLEGEIILNLKPAIAFVLTCMISVGLTTPAWAVEYNPGVSVGQWVKYGNVVAWGYNVPSDFNQSDWMKLEVVAVSGKEVTLHMSGKYRNGTAAREYDILSNVETGELKANASFGPEPFSYLMAANLQKNDDPPGTGLTINKAETRSYLGTNRTVNMINMTLFGAGILNSEYFVAYDRISGMLLEMNIELTSPIVPSQNYRMSFSVVDTNIFSSSTSAEPSIDPIYIIAAIVAIILVIVMVFLILKRKKKPLIAEPPAQTSESKT